MVNRKFTLIYGGIEDVHIAILDIFNDVTILKNYRAPVDIHLEEVIPGGAPPVWNSVLWQPKNTKGTVLFGNVQDGFTTTAWILNHKYKFEMTRIAVDFDIENDEPEYGMFHSFHHFYADGRERLVRAMWDDRWDFYEEGEPMPFEQTERYTERLRRKRLTNDMVLDYAKALGWDLRDPAFWTSDQDAWYLSFKMY